MLPIPLDPESRLTNLTRRMLDIRTFQLPRLRDCRGPLDLHRELAEEIRTDLERVRLGIEACKEMGESQVRASERASTLHACDELERDYLCLRVTYREALVNSKRAIRRHDLLASRSSNRDDARPSSSTQKAQPSRSDVGGDDALQTKTNEVTDALRRTTNLLQVELERSVLSVQMLDESTSTLRLTQSLYDTYANLLSTSATIIRALDRADWYDRLLILSALVLFLAVVGWVLKRRVLDKVVGGVGWWVGGSWKLVRMGFGVRAGVGGGAGRGIGKAVGNAATEVGKAVRGSAAIASGMVAAGTAISGAAGGAGVSISEVAQAVKPKATSAEDMGAEHPYLSDSVVPREPESSAVVVELGPGTDEESRQRDEL